MLPPRFVERYRHARLAFRHQVGQRARGWFCARITRAPGRAVVLSAARTPAERVSARLRDAPPPLSPQRVYDVASRALTTLRPLDEADTVLALLGAHAEPEAARALLDRCIGRRARPKTRGASRPEASTRSRRAQGARRGGPPDHDVAPARARSERTRLRDVGGGVGGGEGRGGGLAEGETNRSAKPRLRKRRARRRIQRGEPPRARAAEARAAGEARTRPTAMGSAADGVAAPQMATGARMTPPRRRSRRRGRRLAAPRTPMSAPRTPMAALRTRWRPRRDAARRRRGRPLPRARTALSAPRDGDEGPAADDAGDANNENRAPSQSDEDMLEAKECSPADELPPLPQSPPSHTRLCSPPFPPAARAARRRRPGAVLAASRSRSCGLRRRAIRPRSARASRRRASTAGAARRLGLRAAEATATDAMGAARHADRTGRARALV